MAEKQLIVAVEGTAALGPFWQTIVSDYLEKIIRCFCGHEVNGQKSTTSNVELSLVMFNAHGSYCAFLVQRSGWTRDVDIFLQWLSTIPFAGGGFSEAAIAEGLSEALMMFPGPQNGSQPQQNLEAQRHFILVAASNPYPLPTPVYRPPMPNQEKSENVEAQTESRLYDAETIAKSFAQYAISFSVICPKQLPKLRALYNAAKRNPRAADLPVDNVKNPQFLILISENFVEARLALSRSVAAILPSNQSPVKMDVPSVTSVAGPPQPVPAVNGSIINRQPISAGNIPTATVKVEPSTVSSMMSGPVFSHIPSVLRPASQGVSSLQTSSPLSTSQEMLTNTDGAQDTKPMVSQPIRSHGTILNTISRGVRPPINSGALTGGTSIGLPSMGGTHMAMHVSNMISSGISSSVPAAQTVFSPGQSGQSGQSAVQPITGSGSLAGTAQVIQHPGLGSLSQATSSISGNSNLGISQSMSNVQGGVSMGQQVPGVSQGSLSGPPMVQSGVGMTQNAMSTNATSGTGTMIPTPGMPHQVQSGMQQLGVNNPSGTNMPLPQQTSSSLQTGQSKYVKVWEGNLSGQRQGQPVFITRLEGYRSASASETLAANWPSTMQIVRLISQDHMNNKQYVGKADFLVFRAMHQHGFLGQLQEKKLCAVIQLPSQTLLLSVSDKACRLIGMLFPGDMVVFKPQISSQQQQQQQQQQQLQQQQQQQQLQQQQHQQQLQQQHQQMQPQQQQIAQLQQLQQQQQVPQVQQHQQLQQQQLQQQQQQQLQQQQQQQQLQQQQQQQLQQPQELPQLQQQQQLPQIQSQQQLSPLQQQQLPQLQQQQLPSLQPQQMVGTSLGQAYVQGTGRSQLLSQGQVSSQGPPTMPGGGYMP